ncbi:MAG: TonB-dependent receptor [Chitinophagaceae bacterium]|nr:TonB-dependent receptor [Chitinophagaceae bacterium]
MRRITFTFAIFLIAFLQMALAQGPVTGRVTDDNSQPLPGVSVSVKGTSNGVTTNNDGRFSIVVSNSNDTLVLSFVGFSSQELAVGGRSSINVTLSSDSKTLSDVVVVGYGRQKKVNLVGAVSAINVDEKLTSRALPNVSAGLTGLVPGLTAVQSSGMAGRNGATLLIRGLGTVNNSGPLVVVDGMPDIDINTININDIETISILKDATSASVYGSRAANGVILITTKSGKGMKRTAINFTSNTSVTVPTQSFDFMADYSRALTLHQRRAATNTLQANQLFKNGTIDQWMALGMIDPLRYPNTDWWDIILRNGTFENYNLSASGGNDVSNFFVSVGVRDEEGLQINNDYKQYNARFNFDYKIKKNMNTGIKFFGTSSKFVYALEEGFTDSDPANTAGTDMQYAIAGITPYDPASGKFGGVMSYGEDPQAYNPYTLYVNSLTRQNRQIANASLYWDWTPVKGLTAGIEYALNYYNQFRWQSNIPNQSFNFQTNAFGSRVYVGPNAPIVNATNTGYKTLLTGRLNYHTTIADNHDINALVVYSEEYWYDRFQASSRNDRLHPSLSEIDAALTDIQSTGGNSNGEGLRSYIGRINYTAFSKYLLEANLRVDGSSKFLEGNQYGYFPSIGLGWRFTEENFIKNVAGFLSNGKLRLSYGSLGNNSGIGRYEQQSTLAANHYFTVSGISRGLVNNKIINRDLSWETTTVLNIGLEFGFFNNRLTTEFDFYDRLTTGMNRPSDMSILLTGAYVAPRKNIGNMRNRGFEGNIAWRDRVGKISYGVNLNASYNATRLEKWNEFIGRGSTTTISNIAYNIFLDMPYNFVYTYEDIGVAQTWQDIYDATPQDARPGDILRKDLNGDGRIDGNDRKAYTNLQRDRFSTNFALNGFVNWRGFDIAFMFQGATGRKDYYLNAFNQVNFSAQRYASTWGHWENPWSLDNRTGDWPRLGGIGANQEQTTLWLDNMRFVRIKNLQLGYSFPGKFLQRFHIYNLRIAGSAENLATFTSYRGLDPEKAVSNNNLYPINKSYSLAIQLGF